ncbi:unnamed protein product, partial [Ectocarpus sp. 4 AP-2014]
VSKTTTPNHRARHAKALGIAARSSDGPAGGTRLVRASLWSRVSKQRPPNQRNNPHKRHGGSSLGLQHPYFQPSCRTRQSLGHRRPFFRRSCWWHPSGTHQPLIRCLRVQHLQNQGTPLSFFSFCCVSTT